MAALTRPGLRASKPDEPDNQEKSEMAQVYIVQGTLKCDGVVYTHGSEFSSENETLVAELRRVGALALPAAALSPEAIAAREAALRAELEALQARVAAAEADKSAEGSDASSDSGESAPTEPAAESAGEPDEPSEEPAQ